MSLGFQNAGFDLVVALDSWESALECYSRNLKHPTELLDLSNVESAVRIIKERGIDVIIGGPPCQDFSMAGKRKEGHRANLTLSYAQIIEKLLPKFFVMENVESARKSAAYKQAYDLFKRAGYGVSEKILDASYCGVPQKRRRFFCIGAKDGVDGFLDSKLSSNQAIHPMTIRNYYINNNLALNFEYYYRHPRSYTRRAIFSIDEASPTVRGTNRPKPLEYKRHPGDLVDPNNVRSLTYSERANIQTFPNTFIWSGALTDIEQMIGNAVPVNLAEYVARCLDEYIKNIKNNEKL